MPCVPRRRALCAAVLLAFAAPAAAVDLNWSAGTFPGGVIPAPEHGGQLSNGEVLNINAGGNKFFNSSVVFLPESFVRWNDDTVFLQHGTTLLNQTNWHAHSDDTLAFNASGNTSLVYPSFTNEGTFRKAGGVGSTTIGAISFINKPSGIVQADMGTIVFSGNIASFESGSTFTGAGTIAIAGNANFAGTFTSTNLELRSGNSINGSNATLAGGTVRYTGGSLTGSWAITAGQSLHATGGNNRFLEGASFTNHGTVRWQTDAALFFRNGALFDNRGTFLFDGNGSLSLNAVSGAFHNSGTLSVADLRSAGIFNTLQYVNNGGIVHAASGATLTFGGGNALFNEGTRFTGPGTVVINNHAWFSGSFTSENASLRGGGTYTGGAALINGALEFQSGTLAGAWTLAETATLFVRTTGNKFMEGGSFTNDGTVRWQAASPLHMRNGALFDNRATFVFEDNGTLSLNLGAATFTNSGTLEVADARSASVSNTLQFVNAGGVLRAGTDALLTFAGGNAHFQDGTRFTGPGVVRATNHASFAGSITSQNLSLQAGGIYTATNAAVHGALEFQSGFLDGSWTLAADATLFGRAAGNKFVGHPNEGTAVVTNLGTTRWQSTAPLRLRDGAVFDNQAVFVFEQSGSLAPDAGSGTFRNSGLLSVADGQAASVISLPAGLRFENLGGEVRAGTGASMTFASGNAHFGDETRFTGPGQVIVSSHANYAGDVHSGNLRLTGGNQTGVGTGASTATLHGTTRFHGGTLMGTWELPAGQTLLATTTANKFVNGGTVTNHGTVVLDTDSGHLRFQNGARLENHGTIRIQASGGLDSDAGGGNVVNHGLIVKTGAAVATIDNNLNFSNPGVIDVRGGTLNLPSNFDNTGTLTGTGTFDALNNAMLNSGHIAPGSSPGTLTIAAAFTQTGSGFLDIELASSALFDRLIVNGTASLDGRLALACIMGCAIDDGDSFVILDSTGALTGTFSSVTTAGFGEGFTYSLVYDRSANFVRLDVIDAGVMAPIPEPETYALLLAGLGLLGFAARRRKQRNRGRRPNP